MKRCVLYFSTFLLISCQGNDSINHRKSPLTLGTAPWANKDGITCERNPKTKLRAHIFAPIYRTYTVPTPDLFIGTEVIFIPGRQLPDGSRIRASVRERIIPNMYHPGTYRALEQQTVGYLTDKNEWVDKSGNPVFSFENFRVHGISSLPIKTVLKTTEIDIGKQPPQINHQDIEVSIKSAPPCTYIVIPTTYKRVKDTIEYRSANQVLTCGAAGSLVKKPPHTFTRNIIQNVPIKKGTMLFTDINGAFNKGKQALLEAEKTSHHGQFCDWTHLSRRP